MNFDFRELYTGYLNVDLLRITLHPDGYREEAVQLAKDILATRNVTDDECRDAGYIIQASQKDTGNDISFNVHTAVHSDVLGSFDPENNAKAGLFFKISFSIICLYYLRLAYVSFFHIYYAVLFQFFSVKPVIFNLVYLLLLPFALVRLYRRKKDGWIFIVAETLFTFIPALLSLIESWRYMLFESSSSLFAFYFFSLRFLLKPLYFSFFGKNQRPNMQE